MSCPNDQQRRRPGNDVKPSLVKKNVSQKLHDTAVLWYLDQWIWCWLGAVHIPTKRRGDKRKFRRQNVNGWSKLILSRGCMMSLLGWSHALSEGSVCIVCSFCSRFRSVWMNLYYFWHIGTISNRSCSNKLKVCSHVASPCPCPSQSPFKVFTGRNEVLAKVIFLHPSVIHSVHRGRGVPDQARPPDQTPPLGPDMPPRPDTHPGPDYPRPDTPQDQTLPPGTEYTP